MNQSKVRLQLTSSMCKTGNYVFVLCNFQKRCPTIMPIKWAISNEDINRLRVAFAKITKIFLQLQLDSKINICWFVVNLVFKTFYS